MSPLVIEILKSLTMRVNLSTGLLHYSDESAAKEIFKALHKEGEILLSQEIESWVNKNGWKPKYAKELGDLAEKIGNGERVVIRNKNNWRPNIIKILKDKIKEEA